MTSDSATAGASGVLSTAGNSGQLMSIAAGSTINGQARNQTFTYDNVGRLLTASGWSAWGRRFAYDRWGNRTGTWNAVSGGTQLQNIAMATTGGVANNRIANVNGATYSYDASGKLHGRRRAQLGLRQFRVRRAICDSSYASIYRIPEKRE